MSVRPTWSMAAVITTSAAVWPRRPFAALRVTTVIVSRIRAVISIPDSTQHVIDRSTFRLAGVYVYVRAGEVRHPEQHLLVARDELETTVVTEVELLRHVEVLERNADRWQLLAIDIAKAFYCVGFLAKISAVLGEAGLDILVVSTFSRDWILVKEEDGPRAAALLEGMGFTNATGS